jgi:outer membrane protein
MTSENPNVTGLSCSASILDNTARRSAPAWRRADRNNNLKESIVIRSKGRWAATAAAVGVAALSSGATRAAEGDWIVRAGAGLVDPKSDNLKLPASQTVQVDDKVGFTFEIARMLTDRWAVELLAAAPFKHDIDLDTVRGTTPFGSVEHLPPTLSVQYHFNPDGRFRPYVGAGINYTLFSSEKPAGLKLDDSVGPAAQIGVDFGVTDNFLINLGVRYLDIDADAKLNGAALGTVEIDPFVYQLQIGWRFGRPAPVAAAVAAPPPPPPPPSPPPPPPPPADTDRDGVIDANDQCPDTKPGVRVGPQGCDCDLTAQLTFRFNSAELTEEDIKALDQIVETLRRLSWTNGVIEGHTDSVGAEAYNQALSERRAESVRQYLIGKGIGDSRMRAVGFGETQPVGDNGTAEGRAANRRVVLKRTDCDNPR